MASEPKLIIFNTNNNNNEIVCIQEKTALIVEIQKPNTQNIYTDRQRDGDSLLERMQNNVYEMSHLIYPCAASLKILQSKIYNTNIFVFRSNMKTEKFSKTGYKTKVYL